MSRYHSLIKASQGINYDIRNYRDQSSYGLNCNLHGSEGGCVLLYLGCWELTHYSNPSLLLEKRGLVGNQRRFIWVLSRFYVFSVGYFT